MAKVALFQRARNVKHDPGATKITVHVIPVTAKGGYKLVPFEIEG